MEDESVSVTSPLANEKGNKRRILDSNGNYISLVCVDSSSKADTAHTPKGNNADCGEWNHMLFKTEDEDTHKMEGNSQNTSFDDLMRFSCQEINHVSKEGKKKHDEDDHIFSGAKNTDNECLVQRVTKLESKFDDIIHFINDSSKFDAIIQSINDLKAVVLNNNVGKPEIMEKKDVEKKDVLLEKNELEKNDVILEKNDKDNEPKFDGNLRTFFPPSCKNRASSPALVVKRTPTGFYIKPQKNLGISSTKVERLIPNWLSLLFKPIKTMNLNAEQSAVASYIFGDTNTGMLNTKLVTRLIETH